MDLCWENCLVLAHNQTSLVLALRSPSVFWSDTFFAASLPVLAANPDNQTKSVVVFSITVVVTNQTARQRAVIQPRFIYNSYVALRGQVWCSFSSWVVV